MLKDLTFSTLFQSLTGKAPFPWQRDLYSRLSQGIVPTACDIPTGLGKTAVIPIWLIALANQCSDIPRRLIYVVNRRVVVDQATATAEIIRQHLSTPADASSTPEIVEARKQLAKGLGEHSAALSSDPLAISTLRGQYADNREWSTDPSRPAIIVGTVDMVGSRLLFGGYGLGFKSKPLHAGFLGQDAWLVHDEAHLEPAFQELIEAVRTEQEAEPSSLGHRFRLKVTALTATLRGGTALGLTEDDRSHPEVEKRLNAKKSLHLHKYGDEKKLVDLLVSHALSHRDSGQAVLVFANTVEVVEKVAEKLRKELRKTEAVKALTGTMRGKERDHLISTPTFLRFLPNSNDSHQTAYLVCTSAGEVGLDISADHLVSDLSTFESMVQRLGRLNRFGKREDAQADVLFPESFQEKDELDARRRQTLELLRSLKGDGSPGALSKLDRQECLAAFAPKPDMLPTSSILFDVWSLTTFRERLPGRPPLEPFLHGVSKEELPQTHIAWRDEVEIVNGSLRDVNKPAELLAEYPLKPHELLRDRSDRIFKHITALAAKHPKKPVWLLADDGMLEFFNLEELADRNRKSRIEGRTILLPPSAGGLENGLFTGSAEDADDVADNWGNAHGTTRRIRIWDKEPPPKDMRLIRSIDTKPETDDLNEVIDREEPSPRYWHWYVEPRFADDDGSKSSRISILWDDHTSDVVNYAKRILQKLPLPDMIKDAIVVAARFHDLGKRRVVWQRGIGNPNPAKWLAKSGAGMTPIEINPYRHEFGSLLDVRREPEFQALSEAQKGLVLHLIAAHHGLGRPHFPPNQAFDPEPGVGITITDIAGEAAEVPLRFARLQKEYGRWGLAYLESLLRAADYAASAYPSEPQVKTS